MLERRIAMSQTLAGLADEDLQVHWHPLSQKLKWRSRRVVQWLRGLPEDQSSVPRTHIKWLTVTSNSMLSSGLLRHWHPLGAHTYMIHAGTYIYTSNENKKSLKTKKAGNSRERERDP